MAFYLLLTSATVVIVLLAWLGWRRTSQISLPLGIGLVYYWSLFGAWSIVQDRLGGDSGKRYGYLEEKLFPIMLDHDYLLTLALYALFIILIEMVLLLLLEREGMKAEAGPEPVPVSHGVLLVLAVVCGLTSYALIRNALETAHDLNLSAYLVTRGGLGELPPYFTIHQLLSRAALLSVALGISIVCSGANGRLFAGTAGWAVKAGYALVAGGLFWFLLILGNKNELLFAGIGGVLLYIANARHPRLGVLAVAGTFGFVGLWLIDTLRGLPLSAVVEGLQNLEAAQLEEAAQFVTSSNEAFSAHFSLYGALSLKVPLTYGESLISMAASMVPRVFWPERPPDVYLHYAGQIGAWEGQGYTIHHVTGWYLNFGVLGILTGALVWGGIWAKCYTGLYRSGLQRSLFWCIWTRLAPWMFVASIPMLIRTGFEGYKALLVEALFLPTVILLLASTAGALFRMFRPDSTCPATIIEKRVAADA